ncbi:hypothetical protein F0562_017832 [Nyssa sinensis]|uniref:Retrotransposon Copia-like N-terminal domain-containing protein n=1 Tax=Nyssa sinensis TaxID=561372 RepID=A0A5J4ZJ41_9ASTE|nr:hypothetical protein F0562_017832 [Nyssa sinensis]
MENSQTSVTTPTTSAAVSESATVPTPANAMTQGNLLPANGNLISLNASSQIPFKLARNGGNYASWKSQMTNLLFGYGLLATVNSTISPMINNCITSTDAWNKLEMSFANRSNTRMISIITSLMSNKKEGKTVAAYMSRVKSLVDDLALIGHPLNDSQIVTYILNGLGDEFKELAAAVRIRDNPISFEDLYDKLLDEELICNHGKPKEEKLLVTAQLIQKGHSGRGGHYGGYNNTTHDLDTNPSEKNSQPNHMQTNWQQPSYG